MKQIPYKSAQFEETSFNCPNCQAFADQKWTHTWTRGNAHIDGLQVSFCGHCDGYSVWRDGVMVSPADVSVEPPNSDLDEDIQNDYREAADILARSPRGAAALLRLAVQKLCDGQLQAKGKGLDAQIGNLVSRGLLPSVQKALDSLRVIGNEAVHPGTLDLKDDQETAVRLFRCVNLIADQMITHPKQAEEIFSKVSPGQQDHIKERDGQNNQ